jgi:hypothetical protein
MARENSDNYGPSIQAIGGDLIQRSQIVNSRADAEWWYIYWDV